MNPEDFMVEFSAEWCTYMEGDDDDENIVEVEWSIKKNLGIVSEKGSFGFIDDDGVRIVRGYLNQSKERCVYVDTLGQSVVYGSTIEWSSAERRRRKLVPTVAKASTYSLILLSLVYESLERCGELDEISWKRPGAFAAEAATLIRSESHPSFYL